MKMKDPLKVGGIGIAVLAVLGMLIGGGGKKDAAPEPTEAPVRAVATPSPVPTATPYRIHRMDPGRTVYVSSGGMIHVENDCSGMKHYTEMTLEEADAAGYEYCSKCCP